MLADTKIMKCDFLVVFDEICFHENTREIFPHSELKWPSYTLPNIENLASSNFAVFLPTDCCDVMSEHVVKRVCVACIARSRLP